MQLKCIRDGACYVIDRETAGGEYESCKWKRKKKGKYFWVVVPIEAIQLSQQLPS